MKAEIMKIEDLGWDDFFQSKRTELKLTDFAVARVVAEHRGGYKVKNIGGEFLAKVTGKQIFNAESKEDYPAVGDWVAITELDNSQAVVEAVLPRKSVIKRTFGDRNKAGEKGDVQIIATNIDIAFIVQSVGRDFNLNRFERYCSIIKDSGIVPVMVINKVDLMSEEELDEKLSQIKGRLSDIKVIRTSAVSGAGLDKLKNIIERGKTYCFLGSSGVGKSSLINRLLGKETIKTGDISSYSERGKHVTTSRDTYILEDGGILIDNPGMREIGMTDAGKGVTDLFDEISVLARECEYSDCTHVHEPGCAVLTAIESGELDKEKYSNYIDLKKETEFHAMNKFEKKEKNRQFGKFMKNAKKDFKRFGKKDY